MIMPINKDTCTRTLATPIGERAYKIVETLSDAGFDTWWVGGCVRDMLQGHVPTDIDIATAATRSEEHTTELHSHFPFPFPLFFFFEYPGHPRVLPSSPARRSSDLGGSAAACATCCKAMFQRISTSRRQRRDRKSTRLNSTHISLSPSPSFFFLNTRATPEFSPLPPHAALPILVGRRLRARHAARPCSNGYRHRDGSD